MESGARHGDTQLQLPPAVEALLQKLRSESTHSALQSLCASDLQTRGWGAIFGGDRDPDIDGSLTSEQVSEVRLLVLAAVGQCRTLKVIDLSEFLVSRIELSFVEFETLLEPLGSSHVLTELDIKFLDITNTAAGAKVLGNFLQVNRCCEVLHIPLNFSTSGPERQTDSILAMTEGMRRSGNGHPALKYLFGLRTVTIDEARALLEACPKLQALGWFSLLSEVLTQGKCHDDSSAAQWGNMYLEHDSLTAVALEGEAVAVTAFMDYIAATRGTYPKKFFKIVRLISTFEAFMEPNRISSLLAATKVLELQPEDQWGTKERAPLRDILDASTNEQSPKALTLRRFEMNDNHVFALASLVSKNEVPERLDLYRCSLKRAKFGVFFRSLRKNTTLRTLNLEGTAGLDDEAFIALLSALEVNSSLHEIDITDTSWDGANSVRKIRLRQALEQKQRRENYIAVLLRDLKPNEIQPSKIGRLFLCGEPYSGKSQLRISLMRLAAKRTRHKFLPSLGLRNFMYRSSSRTEGIEIEHMTINGMQISIWDLAGQETFRALHDCLFPKLNIPCVFLLVFSPHDRESNSNRTDPHHDMRDELLPWLKFIASSARVVGNALPEVKILVSHKDKLQHKDLDWAGDVISEMQDQFKDLLAIDVRVLCANNKTLYEGVEAVLDRVQDSLWELMVDNALEVPQYCVKIIDGLCIKKTHSKSHSQISRPILKADDFFSICQEITSSTTLLQVDDVNSRDVLHAITAFLHDAGIIIHYPKTGLVIVDPNWFTHSFLGKLIGLGHDFQRSHPLSGTIQHDGLITKPHFEKLLLSLVEELTLKGLGSMTAEDLLSKLLLLIEEMDLCFQVDVQDAVESNQKMCVFAPILFAEPYPRDSSRGMRALPGWSLTARNSNVKPMYMGLRVQCQDSKTTHLTPALFPRFQVWYRRLLILQQARLKDLISCKYNLIHFITNGYEIYVENDGNVAGDHIDVLVLSYNKRQETMKYIMQQVVDRILEFGTSSLGCPGVNFEVSILRSECVQNLTLLAHRDEKVALPITTLISDWKTAILERVWLENNRDSNDTGVEYFHTWPKADKAELEVTCERAKDLILDKHFDEVVALVGDSVRDKLKQVCVVEEEITKKFSSISGHEIGGAGRGSGSRLDSTSTDFKRSTSGVVTRSDYKCHRLEELVRSVDKLHIKVDGVTRSINKVDSKVDEVKSMVTEVLSEVKVIKALQEDLQQSLASFNSSLDRITGYSTIQAKIPKRPYFIRRSKDTRHWITARIQIGTPLTLHFMCERRSGSHFVDGQEGFPLTVQKRDRDVLRFLSVNSAKILGYLVKAGVHVGVQLASGGTTTSEVELPKLGKYITLTAQTANDLLKELEPCHGSRAKDERSNRKIDVMEESWRYLQKLFSAHLKDSCAERFQLYKCRYLLVSRQAEPHYAWLCKVCIKKEVNSREIEVCQ